MGLTYIGPAAVAPHYAPSFDWTSAPDARGLRTASISGRIDWCDGKFLSELVAAPERRLTFGSQVGVLEPVWFDDKLLRHFSGWYLLTGLDLPPEQVDSLIDIVPFSLSAVAIPERHVPVVVRSARARANDFGISAQSLVVQPLWGETESGEPFEIDPGGTAFSREYDHRTQYDASSLSSNAPDSGSWDEGVWDDAEWGGTLPGRRLRIHAGSLS